MDTTDEDIYRHLHGWLLNHIHGFASPDEETRRHFEQKRIHSLRVVDEITSLGQALRLEPRPLLIARAIGLLHDAGRFEQFHRYRTFSDAVSADHGDLGAAVVSANGLLRGFSATEAKIITQAIFYHNKISLPKDVSDEALFYLKLVRDADKLDIYRVIMENLADADQALFKVFIPQDEDASEEIHATMMRGDNVNYKLLKNATDRLLMHVGWVFDINFTPALRTIADRGYLEKLADALPPTPRSIQILNKARAHMAAALAAAP